MKSEPTKNPKKKKNNGRTVLTFIGFTLVGALVGYSAGKLALVDGVKSPKAFYWSWLVLIPLVFMVNILVHELGHTLTGIAQGFKFRLLTVGPFMWEKEQDRLQFKWNTNLNTFGGLALCLPQHKKNLVKKFLRYIAGGPLASLGFGILMLGIYFLAGFHQTQTHLAVFVFTSFVGWSGAFSWVLFISTIIPMRAGGFYSDGARMLNLMKGGAIAKQDIVLLTTIAQSSTTTRPRDLDIDALEEAIALEPDSRFATYLHGYLHYAYMDQGVLEKAAYHLDQYWEGVHEIPAGYQAVVFLDKAYFEATYKKDAEQAQYFLDQAKIGAAIPKNHVFRARASVALVQKHYEEAANWARQAVAELNKDMEKGSVEAKKEWSEAILAQAERQKLVLE